MIPGKKSTYNIQNLLLQINILVLFLFTNISVFGQKNKYGLDIIHTGAALKSSIAADSNMAMINLGEYIEGLMVDLRYAGSDNFLKTNLYPANTQATYLRLPAARALKKVQTTLQAKGLSLKIWDAYRPYSVTEKMWEKVQDSRYAADPRYGSGHNRGIAVDLTIIDLKTGKELPMGTGFDNFSDTAHSDYNALSETVLQNRLLLKELMEQNGFKVLDTEWWHFYLPDSKKYSLMNVSFKLLRKMQKHSKQIH